MTKILGLLLLILTAGCKMESKYNEEQVSAKEVVMYTKSSCPYCVKAKDLLKSKNVAFREVEVDSPEVIAEMVGRSAGRRTVPQIFINGFHVGGYDDLAATVQKGELDKLLNR